MVRLRSSETGKNGATKYGMRAFEFILTEGRVYTVDTGYGHVSRQIKVYQNPTVEQAAMLAKQAMSDGKMYLRGLMIRDKQIFVANGWDSTHDDLRLQFAPSVESHSSDLTTFNIIIQHNDVFVTVDKPGDYDPARSPAFQKLEAGCRSVLNQS